MAFNVKFNLEDEFGRKTSRTWKNTSATIADCLADVAVIGPLLDAVIQGGMTGVNISTADDATTFVATSPSNIDENASIKVRGADSREYDFDLPMPIAAVRLAGGAIDVANVNLVAFFDQFLAAAKWRVNLFNPTDIVQVISGTLDK